MKLLRGVAQTTKNNLNSNQMYTYIDSPEYENLQVIIGDKLHDTWWKKDQIAGIGNENFSNFYLWFEYE